MAWLNPDPAIDAFDRRLNPNSTAPIGVAFSGGGDSLMALKAAAAWAALHGRRVIAFHVDHRLQTPSASWAEAAHSAAERIGADFVGLAWEGDKPATGVAAAARLARHRLIADAAREARVHVLVFGHTADDRIEAVLMRDAGHRMGDLRDWSPSPVWPEGRGLFILRPLLGIRRAAIREALAAEGETWVDDPANIDPRSPRARVRPQAGAAEQLDQATNEDEGIAELATLASIGVGGDILIRRGGLRSAPRAGVRRLVGAAVACVGGGASTPRGERLEALTDRLLGPDAVSTTLSGAKISADGDVLFTRNAGEASRGGLSPLRLGAGEAGVWDGRFEIVAGAAAITVSPLAGQAARLDRAGREALKALPAQVRPGLPAIFAVDDGRTTCPILAGPGLAGTGSNGVKPLVAARFLAACGVILKEPAT
jgi:tRNA(Ile)-lysidine synthase